MLFPLFSVSLAQRVVLVNRVAAVRALKRAQSHLVIEEFGTQSQHTSLVRQHVKQCPIEAEQRHFGNRLQLLQDTDLPSLHFCHLSILRACLVRVSRIIIAA